MILDERGPRGECRCRRIDGSCEPGCDFYVRGVECAPVRSRPGEYAVSFDPPLKREPVILGARIENGRIVVSVLM